MYARCVADRFFRGEPFSLVVPEAFCEELQAGCMVLLLSLKGQGLMSIGYVLSLSPDAPPDMVHEELPSFEMVDLLNGSQPVLNGELLKLTSWIADYYLTRPIDAIHTALPVAIRTTVDDVFEADGFTLQAEPTKVMNTALRRSILKLLATNKQLRVKSNSTKQSHSLKKVAISPFPKNFQPKSQNIKALTA